MQSRRVSEFPMSGQSVSLFYYLYQCKRSWPRSCFQYSIEFGSDYNVNNKHPVMVCENAPKHDHVCMCAMCIYCYNKMQGNKAQPSRRTRRSRNK